MRINGYKVTPMPNMICPKCKSKLNTATCMHDTEATVSPNDVVMCNECESLLVFNKDFKLRTMTEIEFLELPDEFHVALSMLTTRRRLWS